ncbi:unnamed protein product [Withania somnifera]
MMEENEEDNNKADKVPTSVITHTRSIGIIYPPQGIRSIVEKTSQFVAKNGPEFEKRIVLNNTGNAKFNFLNASDPHHAYYQHRLAEARAQNQASGEQPTQPEDKEAAPAPPTIDGAEATAKPDLSAQFRPVRKVLEPPEAEQYTVRLPEGIPGEELDIIKLTSQIVARNGKSFLKRSQEQARQKAEDEIEQERLQMAMTDWHDFVVVETIDFADDEDQDLPPPLTLEEVIRRSKMPTLEEEEYVEPGKEVEIEMDEEEVQLVEEGMQAYKEQKDMMFVKIKEMTPAQDDEISRNIVGLARTCPDIFSTTEEEVSNAVKAEIEKKMEEPKQVIWMAMSQNNADDQNDARNLPGPQAPLPPRPGLPSIRPLPPPPGLVQNIPRPPNTVHYSTPTSSGVAAPSPPRPPMINMIPQVQLPPPPMPQMPGQQNLMVNHPPMRPSMAMNSHSVPIPPPPGSQFTPLGEPRPFIPHPMFQSGMCMVRLPPMPRGMPPPPPPEEAPPLPEEPEPKSKKLDESVLIPEDQFLVHHSGPGASVMNTEEGNLKGQVLEITVQSLSETIASLKEKISGEIQLPANKQKLSGKAGFLKENLSLAYCNVASGETLSLSLREHGGRKR